MYGVGDPALRIPIVGVGCAGCAHAMLDAKTAAPPRAAMKLNRFMSPSDEGDVIITAKLIVSEGIKKALRYRNIRCCPMS
jgi:hypothetical protein